MKSPLIDILLLLGLLAVFGCESAPNAPVEPPQADAGGDLNAQVRETVVLNGTGSTSEGNGELRYGWTQVSGPAAASIDGADSPVATVVPDKSGTYVFRLTVTDGDGVSATDEIYLLVLEDAEGNGKPGGNDGTGSGDDPTPPANGVPLADAGPDRQVEAGSPVSLDGRGSSDADGDALRYAWVQVSGPVPVGIAEADSPQATAAPQVAGEYVFRLLVTDVAGLSAIDEMRLLVLEDTEGNGSPGGTDDPGSGDDPTSPANGVPLADAGPDRQVEAGSPVSLDGRGSSDADGDALRYAWVQVSGPVPVGIAEADSPQATAAPQVAGEYVFRLLVTDVAGLSATDEMRLLVTPGPQGGNVSIQAAPIGRNVARVEYLITAVGLDTLKGELIVTGDRVARRIVLDIGAGDNRLLELYAYDSRNQLVAYGAVLIQIVKDQTSDVEVVLQPLLPGVGEIEVEAVFEDFGG